VVGDHRADVRPRDDGLHDVRGLGQEHRVGARPGRHLQAHRRRSALGHRVCVGGEGGGGDRRAPLRGAPRGASAPSRAVGRAVGPRAPASGEHPVEVVLRRAAELGRARGPWPSNRVPAGLELALRQQPVVLAAVVVRCPREHDPARTVKR
jgi:hypothetical protein